MWNKKLKQNSPSQQTQVITISPTFVLTLTTSYLTAKLSNTHQPFHDKVRRKSHISEKQREVTTISKTYWSDSFDVDCLSLHKICENTGFHWPVSPSIRTESRILSLYRKIRVTENPYSRILYSVFLTEINNIHETIKFEMQFSSKGTP